MLGASSIVPEVGESYAYPGSIPGPPRELKYRPARGRSQEHGESRWLSRAGLQAPEKITTTNPHFDTAIISVGHRGEGKFSARAREGVG